MYWYATITILLNMQSNAQNRSGYSVVVVFVHKNVSFFVFKDIGLKIVTLIYSGFLINVVMNNFFPKFSIFFDLFPLL